MFKAVERRYLRTQVADVIRAYIATHRLEPGSRLPTERELSLGLAVSRTVIREALTMLEAERLIIRRTSTGYYTTEECSRISETIATQSEGILTSLRGAWEVRMALEVGAVAIVMLHLNEVKLDALSRAALAMDDAMDRQQVQAEAEVDFHLQIIKLTENQVLMQMAPRILGDYFRALALYRPHNFTQPDNIAAHRHLPLVLALKQGDVAKAQAAFWDHGSLPKSASTPST